MKRAGKCVGKKAYAYKNTAEEVVFHFAKRGKFLLVYECPTCLDFHLTSQKLTKQYISQLKKKVRYKEPVKIKKISPSLMRKRARNGFMYRITKSFMVVYTWKTKLYIKLAKMFCILYNNKY
jgi:hypothetical protein